MSELKRIEAVDQIDRWLEKSREQPVFIFKHSLTCPISTRAYDEYQSFIAAGAEGVDFALVEIQRAREVSNEIAARTGVRHESPQALLFDGGEVKWHASHGAITAASLGQALGA